MGTQHDEEAAPFGLARRSVAGVLIFTLTLQPVLAAENLPNAASVVSGQVSIGTSGNTMTVTQGSDKAIVNWGSFSVGQGASVNFIQPGSTSAILNRVTGSTTSTIAGAIHANGQVFLINPNGIAITSTGSIKVGGGFVGSTLNISDKDFLNDHFVFKGDGASAGVSNAGIITVGRGGYAALIGGTVQNSGLIAVPLGKIGLGSGEQATLNFSGDGFLKVALPTKAESEDNGVLIDNQGILSADGGTVLISVASARDAARHVINLSGVVEANSVSGRDGKIIIGGGQGGDVTVSGTVAATSASGKGGDITVTGKNIALNGATIDASGATGGGSVKIGGDYQGKGNTQRAKTTTVDTSSVIRADANQSGKGGKVIVWSDDLTTFDGLISARGAGAGKGGDAEVSGKARLAYNGFTDLSGPGGFGALLLDPYNITISSDADSNSSGFTASGNDSVINVDTLVTALGAANVEVTTGSGGSQDGDIVVASDVSWIADTTLTLKAAGSIAVNAAITASGENAGLVLTYGSDKDYHVNAPITLSGASATLKINDNDYTLIHSLANFQAISGSASGSYFALAQDLDLSGNSFGSALVTAFGGTLTGLGHTISNLTINAPDADNVGLIGTNDGTIRDLGLVGGSVTGHKNVGGLVGYNNGTISNAYATGTVTGTDYVGGLVGYNNGTISNAYATGTVTGTDYVGGLVGQQYTKGTTINAYATGAVVGSTGSGQYAGGLVGDNSGIISKSYATGGVVINRFAGGLVGRNQGTISNTYATGMVSVANYAVGGLVGENQGTISNSYSTGMVKSGRGEIGGNTGGLVGYNSGGTITASFFDKGTTKQDKGVSVGSSVGVTGLTTIEARDSSKYTGWDFSTDWYQSGDMRPILRSEAATAVGGVISVSNLHQMALIGANLSGTYHLTRNIDASATNAESETYSASSIWGSGGFVPLGNVSTPFSGTFDGQSHVISNLTINRPTKNDIGLFGYVGTDGIIRNVGINGGSVTGHYNIGDLVGHNKGAINNAYATGAVIGKGSTAYVGGLVGVNDGSINNAYASGTVTGEASSRIGGLVGYNQGSISYAYATGAVTEGGSVGGLVGYNNKGTITSSFWDTETTGQTSSAGGGTGLTTTGMKILSNFSDWNIDNKGGTGTVWRIYDGYTAPLLRSFMTGLTITGGSARKTYDGSVTSTSVGTLTYSDANYDPSLVKGTAQYTASSANAGSYSGVNLALNGLYSSQQGYDISTKSGALAVSKATLKVAANDASKTYDGKAYTGGNGVTYTGLVNGETNAVLGGTLAYGGTAQSATNAGSYDITASGLTSGNYAITYDKGALTVNKATLKVAANDASKTYDGKAYTGGNGVTYTGWVNGETSAVLGGSLAYGGTSQGATNAGSYDITASGLTSDNYAITYDKGALTVNKAALTVAANDASKTYDGKAYTGGNGVTYTGWVNGETNAVLGGTLAYGGTAQSATNAGSYDITASGLTSDNYAITYDKGALTVNKAALTVAANDASKTYDGKAYTGGNGVTYTGLVNGETNAVLGGTLAYGGTAQSATNAGSYDITASGLTSDNYAITYDKGALTVNKAALTVAAKDASKTYDGLAYTGGNGVTYTGWVNGETNAVLGGSLVYGGTSQGATNAGSYDITASGLTSDNYAITYDAGQLTVNKAALTVAANDASKTYDGKAYTGGNGVTYTGWVNGETNAVLGGSLVYGGTSQGATNAGSYDITASGLTSGNYAITYDKGTLTVSKAALTVTANDASKTYDGLAYTGGNGVTYTGLVNGETNAILGGSLAYGGTSQGATNAGSYDITASGLTSDNYAITYDKGALTVNKAALTVAANDASKTYDGKAYTGGNGVTYTGWVNGETNAVLGGTLAYGGTAQSATNAGSYDITASGLTSDNYAITYDKGALTVNKAALTVAANDASKTYDGKAYTGGNGVTYTGLVNGETNAVLGGTLAYGGTAQSATNAGSYDITASGLTSDNYAITYDKGALTVNKAALTVAAKDASKTYDGLAYTGGNGVTYTGWVNGETNAVLGGSLVYGGTSQGATNAGSYDITASGLTSDNYAITYDKGALTVNKAALTVAAKDASKTYDGLAYTGGNGVTYTGWVNGETNAVLGGSLVYGGTSQGATNAGSYDITASGLTSDNYAITYDAGQLTVNKAALTVAANDASKTYDGKAYTGGNGVTYTGWVNGETNAVLGGSLVYGGTSQGATNAGSYDITASGLTSGNYAITYDKGTLTVSKAALTVAANDASKTYDGLAYTGGNGVTYTGLVNGETNAILGGSLAYGGTSQGATNAGSYDITASGLTSDNYAITYDKGALTVNKAALTVAANDASKTYDGKAYTGGNGVTYTGWVNGETNAVLGGSLVYGGTSQGATNAGSYDITASGLTSGNYAITYDKGTLTVSKAALTVTAKDASKTYDGLAYTGGNGVTYTGLVNGETNAILGGSLAYGGTSQGATNAGSYDITASGLTSDNYAITYDKGALTVNKAALTVAANDASKTYDGKAYTGGNGVTYTGWVNGETNAVLGGTLAYGGTAQSATNAGSYDITASGLTSDNYAITYDKGALTVNKAALTVAANDASKTYDGKAYTGGNGVTYTGLVNGETNAVLGGTLAYGGTAQNATDAGSYRITASGLTSGNYDITYQDGQLSISGAPTSQPDAGRITNNSTFSPVNFVPSVGRQLVSYGSGPINSIANADGTAVGADSSVVSSNNGQGDIMSTQDTRLSGAVCFAGSDFAISCNQ
uniref:Filamentous haemagglutinin family outer membrane protein n=1 Tax=Marinomonas sp. (strain MWYL1) TaxID=400668 RepID=A6VSI9_MARMS